MNKAFLKEPEADTRVSCPRCGTPGIEVTSGPLDTHIQPKYRSLLQHDAWYCSRMSCEVAYFNQFRLVVLLEQLKSPLFPYELDAPICACFGFDYNDVEADVRDGEPVRIRALLKRSQSDEAACQRLAADGQCCLREIQKLWFKLTSAQP